MLNDGRVLFVWGIGVMSHCLKLAKEIFSHILIMTCHFVSHIGKNLCEKRAILVLGEGCESNVTMSQLVT